MENMNQMMSIFSILIGAFALYSAITGKGPAFKNDYPKAMKAEAERMLRIACWVAGPIMLVTGILDYMGYQWAFFISMGTILPGIVVYVVLFRKKFKQYLK